jgi:SAM-dependent methyltransferase
MFTLDQVVPWGRSFGEYQRMFALTGLDLRRTVLGCGDGPASFNAGFTRRGGRAVSCDPIYQFDKVQLQERIAETYDVIMDQTRQNAHEFVWTPEMGTVEEMGRVRMAAMGDFLDDYESGKGEGRYVEAELPTLPFVDSTFDLAVCSHLLFLYSEQLGEAFHHAAIQEMCRVAAEVRIFPLLSLGGQRSRFVDPCARALRAAGFAVTIETVPYEFQRGGNEMMRIGL